VNRMPWILLALSAVVVLPGLSATAPAPRAPAPSAKPAVVDSVGLLERAVARDSSKWDELFRLGVLYMDKDRSDDAVKVLMKASKLRPKDVPTLVDLGAAYDAGGNAKQAQGYYRQALEVSPGDSVATCKLASSLYAVSEYQKAVDLLRELIVKKPRSHCAYFTLGVAFADAGMYKDAVRMWKKVVELAPDSPEAISAKESIDVLERVIQGR
jgi:tetratricopeptide (TPR) repeat protein